MMALLSEAVLPNLVQTTEGTPALVHCGPFANIAHGTSSVISQDMGLRLADYVVNEVGFATELGFEKYLDLVMPSCGLTPSLAVLVTTVQSLRNQGNGELTAGFLNLEKHIANVRLFGVPVVVAINRFPQDTQEELNLLQEFCSERGIANAISEGFAKGGEGAAALAAEVVRIIDANPNPVIRSVYSASDSVEKKICKVAHTIYGRRVLNTASAERKLAQFSNWGYGALPICIAKTQYSFSDNPKLLGAPTGWTLKISDIRLSAGAGFLVAVAGSMMLMPGLPKVPRAFEIDVDEQREVVGPL